MSVVVAAQWDDLGYWGRRHDFRLLFVKRGPAPAAKVICCAELNQQAMIASNDFPRINRGKSRGHLDCGSCQSGGYSLLPKFRQLLGLQRNLREDACGCQGKSPRKNKISHNKSRITKRKSGESR